MIIELTNGYFIEIDKLLNHTLKQRRPGKTRDGEDKDAVKIHGYFSSVRQAVEKFIALNQIDSMADTAVELREYVKQSEEINKSAVQAIVYVLAKEGDGK